MDVQRNKDLVRELYEVVISTGDVGRMGEFISPDYVQEFEGVRIKVGLEGACNHLLGVRRTYSDLTMRVVQQIAEGEWVASCVVVEGVHDGQWLDIEPTHKKLTFTAVNVDRIVDGLMVEHGGAANLFGPLMEAGAIEATKGEK